MTAQALEKRIAAAAILLPCAGLSAAIAFSVARGWSWSDAMLLVFFYLFTQLGITAGFHRLYAHRSFDTTPLVRFLLGAAGSMAMQGPLFFWVAAHRRHHQCSDRPGDPHSPHLPARGGAGLFHAHVGWMFRHSPEDWARYVPDLLADARAFRMSQHYLWFALAGLILPAAIGGLAARNWQGAAGGLLWGGLARVFFVHNATWAVNSICHRFGRRPYVTADHSSNHLVCALLTLGEGWHNNHHAFPTSARHGLRWWELDVTWGFISFLSKVRLAWDVKLPRSMGAA
jgi:stearoyl-CoA desaturase (delta-9 desaturase)